MGGLSPGSFRNSVELQTERTSTNRRLMSPFVRGCRRQTFRVFLNVYSCGHPVTLHFEVCSRSTSHISGPRMENLTGGQMI